MSEVVAIRDSVIRLREKERYYRKKYPFEAKITYWDADDLKLILTGVKGEALTIKTRDGTDVVVTGRTDWTHPSLLTIRLDHLVELFFADQNHIKAILATYKEFGKIEFIGLEHPGLKDMQSYCKSMDKKIVEEALELKKAKIPRGFHKMWVEMGGDMATDMLGKRIVFYKQVSEHYSQDKVKWGQEMRRLGLM